MYSKKEFSSLTACGKKKSEALKKDSRVCLYVGMCVCVREKACVCVQAAGYEMYYITSLLHTITKELTFFENCQQEMFYGHQGFHEPPSGLVIENYLNHSDDIAKFAYRKKYIFRPAEGHIYIPCIHDIANGYFEPSLLPPDVLRINHYTVKSTRHWYLTPQP